MRSVDVIVPVYGGVDETKACILSALKTIDFDIAQLIVINDASPEPALVEWLIETEKEHGFILLHNENNLGFVATVNRGMQLNLDHDVLLLNSDVEVSGDWLTRLREGAYQHKRTASITPFSNNATICSFPNFCHDNELLFGLSVKEIDVHFSTYFSSANLVEIPTAIGFCMYIRRDCLDEVGYFDVETFGKGYGEENDWCQRAAKSGWPNYHQANVFVYHKGGVSFDIEQHPRKARALELLTLKHPDYDAKVQNFIQQDPAKIYRVEALWKLFASSKLPKVVYVTHYLGGGVQQHVDELSRYYHDKALFLQLIPLDDGSSVSLSVCVNGERLHDSVSYSIDAEFGQLVKLLKNLGVGHIHFHHVMGLHPKVWSLAKKLNCQYDFTVHDYFCINGNPALIDEEGRFVGELATDAMDRVCAAAYPIPVSAEQWRINKSEIIENAERVIFPSTDTYLRFVKYFTPKRSVVAWHPDYNLGCPHPEPTFICTPDKPLKILVLGALSREKGADILERVATKLESKFFEFHLLGYAYRSLDNSVITHGPYEHSKALGLIREINPHIVWFPAQCPETYSYTLSLVLKLGLAVVVPDIGAFPERVSGRSHSTVQSWDMDIKDWVCFWDKVRETQALPQNHVEQKDQWSIRQKNFYPEVYLSLMQGAEKSLSKDMVRSLLIHHSCEYGDPSSSEKILKIVWVASRFPVINKIVDQIPFSLKRNFKRWLSSKPMHEIINGKQSK